MKIVLNLRKKLEESAAEHFERAKKARKKIQGAKKAIERFKQELAELEKKRAVEGQKEKPAARPARAKEWYEKFHWFISSEGFLCIGGRDATTNEIIIKKHTEKNDLVFHTEIPGSPFFVVKTENKTPGRQTLEETAIATASFSRAWKLGLAGAEVYMVLPEQVSKRAPTGEYMPKGAFMIKGRRTYFHAELKLAVGITEDGKVMTGPIPAVKAHCKKYVLLEQGKEKPSDCAKAIAKHLGANVDEVLRTLPAGNGTVKFV